MSKNDIFAGIDEDDESIGDFPFLEEEDDELDQDIMNLFDIDDADDDDFEKLQAELDDKSEVVDVVDRITKLNDRLSHSIIIKNISDAINKNVDPLERPVNYITQFKNKINSLGESSSIYDKSEIENISKTLKDSVLSMIKTKFSVSIGRDGDFYTAAEFLDDLEAIYDFLIVSYCSNVKNYMIMTINKLKPRIISKYSTSEMLKATNGDVFYASLKEKLKDPDMPIIIFFLENIVNDIIGSFESGFDLFTTIANLDPYEVNNAKMLELLESYGNGIIFENDRAVYNKFFEPILKKQTLISFLSQLELAILENCELADVKKKKTYNNTTPAIIVDDD